MGTTLGALLADPDVAASVRRVDAADLDVDVSGVTGDSRRVAQGVLFCCITGGSHDGHDYAAAAVAAGAVALLVARPLPLAVPQVLSDDTRRSTALLAAAFHGHPSRSMQVVGVTGTNGKTTTTTLLASILRHAGRPTGVIGTLTGRHTTPEAPELQQVLADFRDAGMSSVVMEVSSHALALHRVDGCRFTLSVFTNLGRDHLDLHGTLERYFAAKASLFTPELTERGLSNCDDPHGRLLADGAPIVTNCFSSHDIDDVAVTPTSHEYTWRGVRVRVGIGGHFNVMNSLAALTAASLLGVDPATAAAGLALAAPVPGRFEPVECGQPYSVVVDYAHTPDGLREVLSSARHAAGGGRVVVVFGCGGDRDRDKRPEMGAVAAELADRVVVTSDNPRSEEPQSIVDAIVGGVSDDYRDRVVTVLDRRLAIASALDAAQPGDVVVVAGKGHETTQTVGDRELEFDDRAVVADLLRGHR